MGIFTAVEAAGFDGDVLDFGTPARRAAVLLRPTPNGVKVEAPDGPWTPFDRPVAYPCPTSGCVVLGMDDVALLRGQEVTQPRLQAFLRTLDPLRSAPAHGVVIVDGLVVWVTSEADARGLMSILHGLLFDEMTKALCAGHLDEVNRLAWRLWRAAVTLEEQALAIAGLERSQFPEHARIVMGRTDLLTRDQQVACEGLLFHARQGLEWALTFYRRRQAS